MSKKLEIFSKLSIVILFVAISSLTLAQTQDRIIGLRVDPSYFYDDFPGMTSEQIVTQVISDISSSGINTLYIYAYDPNYGAMYPTLYAMTEVEQHFGKNNIFVLLTKQAKLKGLKVIAALPLNNFKSVWQANTDWRIKTKSGTYYKPDSETFLLSAWNFNFRSWYQGFIKDFLSKNPEIDGIEVVEAQVDYFWDKQVDYSEEHNKQYFQSYPKGSLGDLNWINFRAQGLTELHGIMSQEARRAKKQSFVVQTWPSNKNGTLMTSQQISQGCGLDFNGIMNLSGKNKYDFVMAELIWQQWKSEYGYYYFNPDWTAKAGQEFIDKVNRRTQPIIHIELSVFKGAWGSVIPTNEEFLDSFDHAMSLNAGIDIYDYHQMKQRQLFDMLKKIQQNKKKNKQKNKQQSP